MTVLAVFLWASACEGAVKQPPITVEVSVVTRSGATVPLPVARVKVTDPDGLARVFVETVSALDWSQGIPLSAYDSFFDSLSSREGFEEIYTDTRGRVVLRGLDATDFVVVRATTGEAEHHLWVVPVAEARQGRLLLTNSNLNGPRLLEFLRPVGPLRRHLEAAKLRAEATRAMQVKAYEFARDLARQARQQAEPAKADALLNLIARAEAAELRQQAVEAARRQKFEEARQLVRRAEELAEPEKAATLLAEINRLQAPLWKQQAEEALRRGDYDVARAYADGAEEFLDDPAQVRELRARVFEVAGGLARTFSGPSSGVGSVMISPDGQFAVGAGREHSIHVWSLADGQTVNTLRADQFPARSFAFNADGRFVLVGMVDNTLRLCRDAEGTRPIWETPVLSATVSSLPGADASVIAISPDGRLALCGKGEEAFLLYNFDTLEVSECRSTVGVPRALAFGPQARRALCGGPSGDFMMFELDTLKVLLFKGHSGAVIAFAVSPDGRYVISGSEDRTIRQWGLFPPRQARTFEGHAGAVTSLAYSPDGRWILSGSADRRVRLWEVVTGKKVVTFAGHEDTVTCVTFSPNMQYALSGSEDKTVRLWRLPREVWAKKR